MHEPQWLTYQIYATDRAERIGFSVHILMRKRPTGAWKSRPESRQLVQSVYRLVSPRL